MIDLTKSDLLRLIAQLDGSGFEPELLQKLRLMHAERAGIRERGSLVFQWLLPISYMKTTHPKKGKYAGQERKAKRTLCPSLNEYANMQTWARDNLREELGQRIRELLHVWPHALLRAQPRARALALSRASSVRVDEISVDSGGGKVPVDCLVRMGILRGDTPADLVREASWRYAPPGKGSLLIEVFELV